MNNPNTDTSSEEHHHHVCTWKTPWTSEVKVPTRHPEAFVLETGFIYCDESYDVYFCPVCQKRFSELVPR